MFKDETLKHSLKRILDRSEKGSLRIEEIIEILAEKSRFVMLIFLSLPFAVPIQIPGLSTPFGMIICLMGFRMMAKKQFWVPEKLLMKEIQASKIKKIAGRLSNFITKIKPLLHARLTFLSSPRLDIWHGLLIFSLGLILLLPFPIPFANMGASIALLLLSLGLLENDGIFILVSYFCSLITYTFFIWVCFYQS